jgi:predicted nicotinamide N-methyase
MIEPTPQGRRDFVLANTRPQRPPHTPELELLLADEITPIWRLTEEALEEMGLPPPFWAFAWAGGQALARYVLDHPELVDGKRVLDIGAGSGLVGLAAARAGAACVLAADIDAFACAAIALNARANGCDITVTQDDLIGAALAWDVILVGDLFYERPLAERLLQWLGPLDVPALLGDPGRNYFPKTRVEKLASYSVQTTRDLEDREIRETGVYRLLPGVG